MRGKITDYRLNKAKIYGDTYIQHEQKQISKQTQANKRTKQNTQILIDQVDISNKTK